MERAGQIATGSPRTKTELSVVPEIPFKLSLYFQVRQHQHHHHLRRPRQMSTSRDFMFVLICRSAAFTTPANQLRAVTSYQ